MLVFHLFSCLQTIDELCPQNALCFELLTNDFRSWQREEKYGVNSSLEHRFHMLQEICEEANALLDIHGSLIYDMQTQIRNLTMIVERVRRNPGCMINIIRTSPLLGVQDTLHPGQHD